MAFKIATNVASLNTQRWLGVAGAGMSKSLEKLSSGYKINRAADDAAGIAIALKLNVKAAGIAKSVDSANQAIAMLQTAEGGIEQIANILVRLKELATQSASDNNSSDRAALNGEKLKLEGEIDKIVNTTLYGATALLKGSSTGTFGTSLTVTNGFSSIDVSGASASSVAYTLTVTSATSMSIASTVGSSVTTQTVTTAAPTGLNTNTYSFNNGIRVTINANFGTATSSNNLITVTAGTSSFDFQLGTDNTADNRITVSMANFSVAVSGNPLAGLGGSTTIADKSSAQSYMTLVDTAIGLLNTERGAVGASQNQVEYHVANLNSMYENTKAAESTIKDADFAKEMADFTKFQIMNQSGVAMLAQANQLPQMILSLMK
jgi:flagellin